MPTIDYPFNSDTIPSWRVRSEWSLLLPIRGFYMAVTKIEWTATVHADGTTTPGFTFNPWRGCTKVSAGCAHCYAETLSNRNPKTLGAWGPNGTRVVAAESAWKEPLKWNRLAKEVGERHRVFCASLADVFEDWRGPMTDSKGDSATVQVPGFEPRLMLMSDVRVRLLRLILDTPNLDWLLLTKRPQNILHMLRDAWLQMDSARDPDPRNARPFAIPSNVWLGTSVENQAAADERIPHLLRTPAAVRFLSCEALLGKVNLGPWFGPWTCDGEAGVGKHDGKSGPGSYCGSICRDHGSPRGPLDWVIVGGESGPGARPCRVEWVRDIVQQCRAAGVPVFVKQLGQNARQVGDPIGDTGFVAVPQLRLRDKKGGDITEWSPDLRVREFPR